jgi:hypothetical protein
MSPVRGLDYVSAQHQQHPMNAVRCRTRTPTRPLKFNSTITYSSTCQAVAWLAATQCPSAYHVLPHHQQHPTNAARYPTCTPTGSLKLGFEFKFFLVCYLHTSWLMQYSVNTLVYMSATRTAHPSHLQFLYTLPTSCPLVNLINLLATCRSTDWMSMDQLAHKPTAGILKSYLA